MSGPIKPSEVAAAKANAIPNEVYEAFNELIAKNWDGHEAVVGQGEAASLALDKLNTGDREVTSAQLYANHWMDVEGAYRKMGWRVEYDKPGYCEDYEPTYTFRKGKRAR